MVLFVTVLVGILLVCFVVIWCLCWFVRGLFGSLSCCGGFGLLCGFVIACGGFDVDALVCGLGWVLFGFVLLVGDLMLLAVG